MEIYYMNHLGEKINLSEWPIAIDDVTPLFAKRWDYEYVEQKNRNKSKLTRFYRTLSTTKIKVQIFADSKVEYEECMRLLQEVTEKDILNQKSGKLFCNNYYLPCYFVVDEPNEYEEDFYTIDMDVEVVSFEPHWIKEREYNFQVMDYISTDNKRYSYKYSYRYANGLNSTYIINENFVPSNFRLIIYGPVINPMVVIGENTYLVNIVLESGERLEIDSREETIVKIMKFGERVNAFHNRQKQRTFFKKIQSGRQSISWTSKFPFDLILYEERSEPKWNK